MEGTTMCPGVGPGSQEDSSISAVDSSAKPGKEVFPVEIAAWGEVCHLQVCWAMSRMVYFRAMRV